MLLGDPEGDPDGDKDGVLLGDAEGDEDGADEDGAEDGAPLGVGVGSLVSRLTDSLMSCKLKQVKSFILTNRNSSKPFGATMPTNCSLSSVKSSPTFTIPFSLSFRRLRWLWLSSIATIMPHGISLLSSSLTTTIPSSSTPFLSSPSTITSKERSPL